MVVNAMVFTCGVSLPSNMHCMSDATMSSCSAQKHALTPGSTAIFQLTIACSSSLYLNERD